MVLSFDGSGALTDRYLYGQAVDQILADENIAADKTYWALPDNQGTVRDVIDSSGTVAEHIAYDSFGNIVSGPRMMPFSMPSIMNVLCTQPSPLWMFSKVALG